MHIAVRMCSKEALRTPSSTVILFSRAPCSPHAVNNDNAFHLALSSMDSVTRQYIYVQRGKQGGVRGPGGVV